ncbi:hypothetical protein C8J56DRAFT_891462 [Mycena floridula]|nr:hypothetical protein C8J56DRAFT_891462 [Mycena floridula]
MSLLDTFNSVCSSAPCWKGLEFGIFQDRFQLLKNSALLDLCGYPFGTKHVPKKKLIDVLDSTGPKQSVSDRCCLPWDLASLRLRTIPYIPNETPAVKRKLDELCGMIREVLSMISRQTASSIYALQFGIRIPVFPGQVLDVLTQWIAHCSIPITSGCRVVYTLFSDKFIITRRVKGTDLLQSTSFASLKLRVFKESYSFCINSPPSGALLPGATTTPVTTSGSKKTPAGAIAAGVVGACVLSTLLGLFLFWRRKHQRKEKPSAFTDQQDPGSFLREKDVPPGQEAYTVSHPAYIATLNKAGVEASESSPKSVYSEKGSVTLSYRPFSSASIDFSSSMAAGGSSSAAQDRSEIRCRIMELERLVEESEAKEDEESPAITQMKERIQMLTQENERLVSLSEAPPSYIASDSGVSSAAGDVKGNDSVLKVEDHTWT